MKKLWRASDRKVVQKLPRASRKPWKSIGNALFLCISCKSAGTEPERVRKSMAGPTKTDQKIMKEVMKFQKSYFSSTSHCIKYILMGYEAQTPNPAICELDHRNFFTLRVRSLVWVTFSTKSLLIWDHGSARSRIFRNPSNFDELYLRAQWIFFQNSKSFENIYV